MEVERLLDFRSVAIRKIFPGSDDSLRRRAHPVVKISDAVLRLLDDMAETMYHAGGVGLAATQVGIARRLVVVDPGENQLLQLINPCCLELQGECVDLEGCLSLPGLTGEVPRAERVIVEALDRQGQKVRLEAEGLLARILQHEIDHLDGILFIDRATRIMEPGEGDQP